jgi:hypothetical protein
MAGVVGRVVRGHSVDEVTGSDVGGTDGCDLMYQTAPNPRSATATDTKPATIHAFIVPS